jgi:hypothetical protein
VEYFSGHVKYKIHNYKLVTKWVGWDETDNTLEPLFEKAEESPELVLEYLQQNKENTEELIQFVKKTTKGKTNKSIL